MWRGKIAEFLSHYEKELTGAVKYAELLESLQHVDVGCDRYYDLFESVVALILTWFDEFRPGACCGIAAVFKDILTTHLRADLQSSTPDFIN